MTSSSLEMLHQCPECDGLGYQQLLVERTGRYIDCSNCDGTGWLDEHGEPLYLEPEIPEINNANK